MVRPRSDAAKPGALIAPKDTPREEPEPSADDTKDERQDEGKEGGVIGGVPDGMVGGVAPTPPPKSTGPKQLSMKAGNQLLAINPNVRPYRVNLPEEFIERMGAGAKISPVLQICVTAQGTVQHVTIVKGSFAVIDAQIPTVIPRWTYRPYLVDGRPEPFCYLTRYSVKLD